MFFEWNSFFCVCRKWIFSSVSNVNRSPFIIIIVMALLKQSCSFLPNFFSNYKCFVKIIIKIINTSNQNPNYYVHIDKRFINFFLLLWKSSDRLLVSIQTIFPFSLINFFFLIQNHSYFSFFLSFHSVFPFQTNENIITKYQYHLYITVLLSISPKLSISFLLCFSSNCVCVKSICM